jgi:hypothetical protein
MSNLRRLKSMMRYERLWPPPMKRGDAAEVVAAARLGQAFGQRLDRLALVELRAVDQTSWRRLGVVGL